jgi:hypothetical protein
MSITDYWELAVLSATPEEMSQCGCLTAGSSPLLQLVRGNDKIKSLTRLFLVQKILGSLADKLHSYAISEFGMNSVAGYLRRWIRQDAMKKIFQNASQFNIGHLCCNLYYFLWVA